MKPFSLDKRHKLCRLKEIEQLFGSRSAKAALAYPIRAVWTSAENRGPAEPPIKILISVPKKKLRKAVERVRARRLIREAYRLNRPADASPTNLAFIYVADRLTDYAHVERSVKKILEKLQNPE